MNFIQQIYDFNKQAGLLDDGYSDFRESSFQIEEALEGFPCTLLHSVLQSEVNSPKELSRTIVDLARNPGMPNIPDVDRLDKAIDAIVFAVGAIAKLGLTPSQIEEAISIVTEANTQKLSMPKDAHGKLTKPADFVDPTVKLQALLDRIKEA